MTKRTLALVIAAIAITSSVASAPSPADARSILDVLFGDSKDDEQKGPPPEVTLQAPFSSKDAPSSSNKLMDIYDTQGDSKSTDSLDTPHRSPEQIAEWTSAIVSQAMTITPATWDKDFEKISANFTPFATQEYKDYVQNMNLVNILVSNQMHLQAISDGPGIVVKEGAISNTYHWLIQVPLMTSFYKSNMKEVDKNGNFQSQNLLVQVQVGRVAPKTNGDIGLIIERWHVSAAPK